MRIVAVSDLHGHLPEVPPCDLLLLAGDLTPATHRYHDNMAAAAGWFDGPFRAWLDAAPAAEVVGVAGNHDWVFQKAPHLVSKDLRWTYLQDSGVTKFGLKLWGTPWQPWFHDWAFNAHPEKMRQVAGLIPLDTDVLVMHGPPKFFGDTARRWEQVPVKGPATAAITYEHVGCPHLRERVFAAVGLRLAVFGHIHSGRGVYRMNRPDDRPDTLLANVALVNEDYLPVHRPIAFDFDAATGRVEVAA